jgi:hypothetical protein
MQPALQRLLWVLLALAALRSALANEVFVGEYCQPSPMQLGSSTQLSKSLQLSA